MMTKTMGKRFLQTWPFTSSRVDGYQPVYTAMDIPHNTTWEIK
jgi:hypothetical protein